MFYVRTEALFLTATPLKLYWDRQCITVISKREDNLQKVAVFESILFREM
jgi:hypothetical protein